MVGAGFYTDTGQLGKNEVNTVRQHQNMIWG